MTTIGEYEAWKTRKLQNGVGAATVVLGSVEAKPDQLAGDLNIANEFGKLTGNPVPPAPMVGEYRSVFQAAIEKKRAETILSSSPRLTEWLRNPENATLASDDLEGLSWWETAVGATGNAMSRFGMSIPQTYNQYMAAEYAQDAADLKRGFGDILYDQRVLAVVDGKEVRSSLAGPDDIIGAAWRYLDSRIAGGVAAIGLTDDPAQVAAGYQMRAEELRQEIASTPMSPGAQAVREKLGTISGGTWQEQLGQFGALIAEDPLGFTSFVGQVALESVPAIGVSTAVGVATRSPTAAAATMGALSGAREYGGGAGDVVADAGYDLTTPEGALAAISDEALMRRANDVGQTRAIIIGALDGLSGGLAGKVMSESPVGNMMLQTLTQALFGSGGEAAAQFAAGQELSLADIMIEGIAEAFTAPVEVAGMGITKVRKMQAKARDAEGRVAMFTELSGQAVASKLRARMPDRFRQFVEQATANGPVENVFVPAAEFQRYFQEAGIDPYDLIDEFDGVTRDDFDAAMAGGGDLKIPTATYAAKIAGSEHDAFLMQNMRFDPLDMTATEAAEFNARIDDAMQEMWAEAEDIRADEERWRAVEDKIHDQVVSSMRVAGLSTERATTEAQAVVAFYRTRAARMGLATEEYLARHPLPGIQGAIPSGMEFKNVDELNRTLAEARNRRAAPADKRQSLLEFIDGHGGINDPGGELRARDAAVIKRPGKKSLRLLRESTDGQGSMLGPNLSGKRFGIDDVAQAAVEAGFMADNPDVIAWKAAQREGTETPDITRAMFDAIDAELRGEKQVSADGQAPVDQSYLDDIEEYLNSLGMDLSNTDDEIRAAIEAAQAEPDRMYGQDGALLTDSAAFKAWFGDSVVVDADGKPLVVKHGTRWDKPIDAFMPLTHFGTASAANQRLDPAERFQSADGVDVAQPSGRTYPVYLSMQNPLEIGVEQGFADGGGWEADADMIRQVSVRLRNIADGGENLALLRISDKLMALSGLTYEKQINSEEARSEAAALIEEAGYDGLTYINIVEDAGKTSYVPVRSGQIKSVFNRGTFDANDPRVLYQSVPDPRETIRQYQGGADVSRAGFADLSGRADDLLDAIRDAKSVAAAEQIADKWVVKQGKKTGVEHLIAFDKWGGLITVGKGDRGTVDFPKTLLEAGKLGNVAYATHNHPRNSGFSAPDLMMSADFGMDISAMGHGGAVVSGRAGPALAGKILSPDFIGKIHGDIDGVVRIYIQDLIDAQAITVDQAIAAHSHAVDVIRHRFGLIDLRSNGLEIIRGAGIDIQSIIAATDERVADVLARNKLNVPSVRDFAGDQAPGGSFKPEPTGTGATGVSQGGGGRPQRAGKPVSGSDPRQLSLFEGRRYYQQAQATDQPLYVVHNLSAEKLRHAAALGGLAAPSLAVARGDLGFDDFGEISLIGAPSLADPKTKGVRLFNADVYSPRQPRARFKVDSKAARALSAVLSPVAERLGLDMRLDGSEIERDGLSAIAGQMVAKAAWLESQGQEVPLVREDVEPKPEPLPGYEGITGQDWYELKTDPAFLNALRANTEGLIARATTPEAQGKVRERFFDADGNLFPDRVSSVAKQVAWRNTSISEWKPTASGKVIRYLTGQKIDKAVGERIGEFNAWVREKFGGVVTDMFFENEAGRKKEYTLGNLVREMTRTIRNGESWNYGAGNVRAAVAPEFRSLAEVKAARGQITDKAAMEALKTEVNDELFALADKFAPYHSSGTGFGWGDIFSEFLRDLAKGPRAVNEWQSAIFSQPAPDELINEARAFLEKLKGLPTNYFEIKMQRGMEISEFKAALIPSNLADDARQVLTDAGLELVEYQRGDDGGVARNAALQQIGPKVFFQPAYHGTPHLFDRFSLDNIGTGEGNQAFGWGLYFAGRKEVAEHYRAALTLDQGFTFDGKTGLTRAEIGDLVNAEFPGFLDNVSRASGVADKLIDDIVYGRGERQYKDGSDRARVYDALKSRIARPDAGRLFQVEIPDDQELLDWDAPLSEQPAAVKELLKPFIEELRTARMNEFDKKEILTGKATGEAFYRAYSQHLATVGGTGTVSDPRAASEALRAAGIPGHRYLDGGSRADGDGSRNYVIYDDSRVRVSSFEQNTQGPRGQISFNMDGSSLIQLFESANLSTVQHELGHLFLTMMQKDAAYGDQGAVAEYEVIKTWWRDNAAAVAADGNRAMPDAKLTAEDVQRAIDTGSTGDVVKDAAVDVGMQEQWARGYEAYLMEGKAPSVELRGAFEKFRSWMLSVYKSLVGLNVKINDDIRGVFDRMLATDEEIAKAKQAKGDTAPVFSTAEQMGLTADEFDRLMKLRVQSEDEAKARLQAEIMGPIRRETEKEYMAEKAKVTETVTRQVNAMPVFRALEWLGNRRWLGDDQPEALPDMRMSKAVLVDRYGEGILKTLPRGMQTVYTVEGGMDPDEVAGWFGFESGDKMLRLLERAPKRADAIKAEVEAEMYRRHGDPLKDGEIERKALDAIHTDRRGEWLAAELKAVAEVAGVDVKLTMKDARASARMTVSRMKVRDAVAANRYLAAERKAGEEALRLGAMLAREGVWMQNARRRIATKAKAALRDAGTVDAVAGQIDQANASTGNYNETVQRLIDAKRRQLMNHALFMEARSVADEVAKAERFVQKLNKATMRERIAGAGRRENAQRDYLGAIDEIMDRYDFRKMSGRAEDRRGALVAFVDAMKAAGRENELAIPEAVLRDAVRKPYKTLSVEEMRGVVDSLKNIQHIALRWNDLIDAKNKAKLDEAVADIAAAFDANMPKRPPGRVKTAGEGVRHSVRQFLDLVLNANTLLREIDGFKDMGAAYRHMKSPIDQAMDRLTVRKEKAAADMEALYAVYSKEDRRRMAVREFVPALGYSLSKWERIAVALNTGNEGNMQRMTDPKVKGSLTEAQVQAVLARLDARDADFVQSVWDYVGSFRDDIAARERRATGVEPTWVDASPVLIAGKTLKGGYYPLKYDPRLSTLARDDETQSMAEALQAGRFGKAQTKRGHLEARAQSSGRDVELDMSVLHRHVNQVIYDLELSEPVANSWKLLQSGAIRQAFMDAGRQADFDALEIWLKDVAEGQLSAGDWINKNARRFKSNFTAAKLAFNLGSVMAQITGVSQTMVVVGKKDFMRGLQASFRAGVADEIAAKSPFMASRRTTFNKDISDFYDDPSLGPTASRWGEIKRDWIGPASFWMMTKVQWGLVDIPTWMAGYQQGLRLYQNDEAQAVAHADAIVKRAQASGLFADRSAIERGSVSRTARQNDVVRLFTALGSYMFAKFNVAYERAAVGGRVIRKEGVSARSAQEVASLTIDMAFLFTLEAIVMAALKGALPGDDDDDGDVADDWAAFLAKETAFSVLGTIPFVRDVASFGKGFEGGGAYGGIVSEIGKPFVEVSQGEIDRGFVKSLIGLTGLFAGLPSTQINRGVDAAWRDLEGEDVSPMEYLLGRMGK